MKLSMQSIKNPIKTEAAYIRSIKEIKDSCNNLEYLSELHNFLKIETQIKNNLKSNQSLSRNGRVIAAENLNSIGELSKRESRRTLSYIPKSKVKFIPGNLMSHNYTNSIPIKIKAPDNSVFKSVSNSSSINMMSGSPNKECSNNSSVISGNHNVDLVYNEYGFNNKSKSVDKDYLNFKTNFILKFSKNIAQYDKLMLYVDGVPDSTKRYLVSENFKKLKKLAENKDRILFDIKGGLNASSPNDINNIFNWKETIIFFFEFESVWQKLTEIILKELKCTKELMIAFARKNSAYETQLKDKDQELAHLNEFIRVNDLHAKVNEKNLKMKRFYDIKEEYERKENLHMINLFRMQEEMKDLAGLLDKDKDYLNKYKESLEVLENKNKEIEDVRLKHFQDMEDKKLKISQLNVDKHENNLIIIELEKNLEDLKIANKRLMNEFIEFKTQIKVLSSTAESKDEIIQMLTNEVDSWKMELMKEKKALYLSEQNVLALEYKLKSIKDEKI